MSMVTYKIPYTCDDDLYEVIKSYNNLLHFTYNRLLENPKLSTKELTALQKEINTPDYIMSYLRNSAIRNARALIEKSKEPIIFGGKNLFKLRCKHKISHEEFIRKRLMPIHCEGEGNQKGNRLFGIIDQKTIIFKLTKNMHFTLNLHSVGYKRSQEFNKLIQVQNSKLTPITYKLDLNYIYITFDYNALKNYTYKVKQDRVIAIDMNPNRVGYSVVDWLDESHYNIIASGSFCLKPLNDYQNSLKVASSDKEAKYITNKRKHELIHIAKELFELCKHFKCEIFAIEKLNIKSGDKGKGRRFNKQCNNQWDRGLLFNQLKKYITASSTLFQEVEPNYTSILGNIIYRQEKLPDEVLSSIEIGRRGYEFSTQYIFNRRPSKHNVIFPELDLVKNQIFQSLEELGIDVPKSASIKEICYAVIKSGQKYRFSLSDVPSDSLFSKFYKQKYLIVYTFI